ncbi:hypothetical protein K501DRAFT_187464 [Backusella circina FSU 941]|nr:hypothetical protein K501DRAFT_187464 [Backusella circina FSU 941]
MDVPITREFSLSVESLTPTIENLTATPHCFIPTLGYIICEIEKLCSETEESHILPRRFTLLPFLNLKWRYITLNDKAISSGTKKHVATNYKDKVRLFHNVFDFTKFRFGR